MNSLGKSTLGNTFLAISIFCLVILIILLGKPLLAPIALSCILAFVLTPVVRRLESSGIGRMASVLIVVISLTIVTVFLSVQLFVQLNALVKELPEHKGEIEAKLASFRTSPDSSIAQLVGFSKQLLGDVTSLASSGVAIDVQKVAVVDEKSPIPWIASLPKLVADVFEPLALVVVVIVLVVYILISREDLRNRFLAMIGNRHLTRMTTIINESSNRMGNYLLGLVSVNLGFALCFGLALYFLSVPYAVVWSAVTFVFRFVPLLGSFVSMLLPVSVSLLLMPGWFAPASVVLVYLALELVTGNVLEPWLFGKSVGMNPFALLIAIMFWTWAWGPIGLLMATPLSLILATLGRHLPYLKSVDFLLSDERPLAAHLVYFQRLLANDVIEAEALLKSIQMKRGLPFVVDMVAIRSMAHSDRELKAKKVTSELHNLVGQRNDALIWKIMEGSQIDSTSKPESNDINADETSSLDSNHQLAFGISMGGERTIAALHTVSITCPKLQLSLGHTLSSDTVKRIVAKKCSIVIISSVPSNPWEIIEAFTRRLRRAGFSGWLAVGNWRVKSIDGEIRKRLKEAGVDYTTHRLHSLCRILNYASDVLDDDPSIDSASDTTHTVREKINNSAIHSA